jgi:SAM-dependent methyltransferase
MNKGEIIMAFPTDARAGVRRYYLERYQGSKPAQQEWTAGTAMPELINLVIEGRLKPKSRVLDIGCGIGTEATFLAVQGFEVSAIDISEQAIEQAQYLADFYGTHVDWHVGDVLHMPFADEQFAIITDRGCFHCIRPDERHDFAREIGRLLKPGGLYVLRCIANQKPGVPLPDHDDFMLRSFGVSSKEIWETFGDAFICEHMELIKSFPSEDRPDPYGWYCLWYKG